MTAFGCDQPVSSPSPTQTPTSTTSPTPSGCDQPVSSPSPTQTPTSTTPPTPSDGALIYEVVEFDFDDVENLPWFAENVQSGLTEYAATLFLYYRVFDNAFQEYFGREASECFELNVFEDNIVGMVVRYGYSKEHYKYSNFRIITWNMAMDGTISASAAGEERYWIDFVIIPKSEFDYERAPFGVEDSDFFIYEYSEGAPRE